MSVIRFASALSIALLVGASAAHAAAPVQFLGVKLQDPSTDPSIAHMRIVLDHETVKPGRVTLHADNQSKGMVHEVIVIRDEGKKQLPFDPKSGRVVERKLHSLGEISDLKPGTSGELTLDLKPGRYLLLCNQPGHYKEGMVAKLTVAS
jgi:uncharacterized cupredoxin-like copper-binding protein